MDIRQLSTHDDSIELSFGLGQMSRESVAWHPETGAAVRNNVPRIVNNKIPIYTFKPQVFYTFTEPHTFMDYSGGLPNGTGFTYFDRATTFEAAYPAFQKLLLGYSHQNRPIYAYRLPKVGTPSGQEVTTKHCVFTSAVHGNEVDGIDGLFKAVEILHDSPAFQDFREEWTLMWVPAMNPDGWVNDRRNTAQIGPNGKTINLNRNWDWFWDDFVESDFESKGFYPHSTSEASALINYFNTVSASGGRFGAMIDFHATEGVPARYQSRDRIYKFANGGAEVPDCDLTISLDWYVWQIQKSFETQRLYKENGNGRDSFIRYYRSRFRPHMHAYFSSQGVFSVAVEEVKVDAARPGKETIASACNYRLSYALAFASAVTATNWEYRDAMLIEKGTTNILSNADWTSWQDKSLLADDSLAEERPGFFNRSRAITERITSASGIKLFEGGEAMQLHSALNSSLPYESEFNAAAIDGDDSIAIVVSSGTVYSVPRERYYAKDIFPNGGLQIHTTPVAAAACSTVPITVGQTKAMDILGGGTRAFTGASSRITRIETSFLDGNVVKEIAIEDAAGSSGTGFTARMHAGYCENALDNPTDANKRCWLFGGQNAAGTYLSSIGVWAQNARTFSTATATLPSGIIGMVAVYSVIDGLVYLFGGQTTGGKSKAIFTWDPVGDSLTEITSTVSLPSGFAFMAGTYFPSNESIYLYGGEAINSELTDKVYQFSPVDRTIEEILPTADLNDDEDSEADQTSYWHIKFARWPAVTLNPSDGLVDPIMLAGGLRGSGLSSTIFIHDPSDNVLSPLGLSSYGYVRYSTVINSAKNESKFALSVFVKSAEHNKTGYIRTTLAPRDNTSPVTTYATRYVRAYYTIPPKNQYKWYHQRLDLREGDATKIEDGIRQYVRLYKDNQTLLLDGLHLASGTLFASSYQHPDYPRSDESFKFPKAINPNNFYIEFYWMATAAFIDLDADLELARISVDANNYIALVAKAGDRYQRQYNTYNIHGPHDPAFELQKYVDGSLVATASVISYWGYDLREPSSEGADEVIKFTLQHIAGDSLTLKVDKVGHEGREMVVPGSDMPNSNADIIYNGAGWYGTPKVFNKKINHQGRKLPVGRKGLHNKVRGIDRTQVLIGERDVDNGDQVLETAYTSGDTFDRADSVDMGADWTADGVPFYSVGQGWNIVSNQAQCKGSGFIRWDRYPRHSDIILKCTLVSPSGGFGSDTKTGLMAKWDDNIRDGVYPASGVGGYGLELAYNVAHAPTLNLVRWDLGHRTILDSYSNPPIPPNENAHLTFTLNGSSLSGTLHTALTGPFGVGATDTTYKKPRRTGIYGITPGIGGGQVVTIDDFLLLPNHASGITV